MKNSDADVRRQAVHGVELRGRKAPTEILPILKSGLGDISKRVRDMVAHVISEVGNKKHGFNILIEALDEWANSTNPLILSAITECLKELEIKKDKASSRNWNIEPTYAEKIEKLRNKISLKM